MISVWKRMFPVARMASGEALVFATLLGIGAIVISTESVSQGEILARVNGRAISQAEVAFAIKIYAAQLGTMPDDAQRSTVVDAMIETRVVADAARAAGLDKDENYKRQMAFFEDQTLRSIYMDRAVAAAVSDQAVKAAYDKQIASMKSIEEVRASHILLASETEAQDAIEALQTGSDFAELAKSQSRDETTKANGGDLGFVATGQGLPEIEAAAANLQSGQYSQAPMKSAFGFHVVKLNERRDRPVPSFEAAEPGIRQSLEAAEAPKVTADLRSKAAVEKLVPDVAPPPGHMIRRSLIWTCNKITKAVEATCWLHLSKNRERPFL